MNELNEDALLAVAARLACAKRVLFITGAGLSADSGLPTYRGVGGLYANQNTDDGMRIETALSGEVFREDPAVSWRYIMQIEQACRGARPNRGHRIMAALQQHVAEVWVLTQNVDGLHRLAGSEKVIDIHGDVHQLRCTGCAWRQTVADYSQLAALPRCDECSAVLRPEVVLFGEMLAPEKVYRLQEQLRQGFDVVFSVGTTSVFPYIAQPIAMGRRQGAMTIEINPQKTDVSALVEHRFACGASQALAAIWGAMGCVLPAEF
jgi:NAD-dependent deacetylase